MVCKAPRWYFPVSRVTCGLVSSPGYALRFPAATAWGRAVLAAASGSAIHGSGPGRHLPVLSHRAPPGVIPLAPTIPSPLGAVEGVPNFASVFTGR